MAAEIQCRLYKVVHIYKEIMVTIKEMGLQVIIDGS